ncbi:MAG: hypothetical protein Udaeo2_11640 [Candidatus Udaeobacter sp.]|nr:MAG: hypothetical protein Udaeo2_11640 [Candidatus Udaeobacter sp.]
MFVTSTMVITWNGKPTRSAPPLRKLSFDQRVIRQPWLWSPSTIAAAPTPRLPLAEPEARVIMREPRHLVVQIRSRRRAVHRADAAQHAFAGRASERDVVTFRGTEDAQRLGSRWHRIVVRGAVEATIDLYLQQDETIDARQRLLAACRPKRRMWSARDASVAIEQ